MAMANRSLRSIRTELEFLTDSSVITPQQLSSILAQLPTQTFLHAPLLSSPTQNGASTQLAQEPPRRQEPPRQQSPHPPVNAFANTSINEKQNGHYAPSPAASPLPPPAYGAPPAGLPVLATASALYQYNPTDAGDLALLPNDRIMVHEYVNNEWWKGRNERTGQEGIFPQNYVRVFTDKPPTSPQPVASNYGNMPLDVSQSASTTADPNNPNKHSKYGETGKKFGKKLGNAAIFGAGATIGGDIVNSIF